MCDLIVGDLVLKRTHILSNADKGLTSGMSAKRDGPWEVTKILGGGAYALHKLENGAIKKSLNVKDLLPYILAFPIEVWSEDQTKAMDEDPVGV
uniref:Uncharacterized protein n=1 Tax=Strigamia maritima TaxID=126957 RepID=T1ILU1_STRMM